MEDVGFMKECRRLTEYNYRITSAKRKLGDMIRDIHEQYPKASTDDVWGVIRHYRSKLRNRDDRDATVCAIMYLVCPEVLCGAICKQIVRQALAVELEMTTQGISRIMRKVSENHAIYTDFAKRVWAIADDYTIVKPKDEKE